MIKVIDVPPGHIGMNGKAVPSYETAKEAVRTLIRWVGQDPDSEGLDETPERVLKALAEMTQGYKDKPEKILSKTFKQPYDELVLLRGVPFTSLCEHHLLPFIGTVDIGYIPGKVVGLSKLARLVECFANRLQIQERMTTEIADSLMLFLQAQGAAVVVKARHSCMGCRGVKKPTAVMVTSSCLGVFRDNPAARAEFFSLCNRDCR